MRKKLTDEEMDSSVSKTIYQVDYNDPIYRRSTFDPTIWPAIPVIPRVIITFSPDIFNKSTIFSLAHLVMVVWMLVLLTLIIFSLYYGKCQNFFWVPTEREVVEINPLDKSAGFGVCFFDYWLSLVGHEKEEQHCFLELWKDKFGFDFPNGICRNCISMAAQLISENRLVELTQYENRKDCMDVNCQFGFFQRQLRVYDNRVPGFDCEICSKEAYIQLLRTSYSFNQNPEDGY